MTNIVFRPAFASVLVLGLMLLAGCETVPTTTDTGPRRQPTFDFTPPEVAELGSSDVIFAITEASFSTLLDSYTFRGAGRATAHPQMFRLFASNMASDFEEILVARGFAVRGPFDSFQTMTFPDRDESDLILTAEVDLVPAFEELTLEESLSGLDAINVVLGGNRSGPVNYRVGGSLAVQARVNLRITESVTNELMWTRSLDLGSVRANLLSESTYSEQELTLVNLLQRESAFYSELGIALESQYAKVMQTTWDFLNPTEMKIVSNQAQKVRDRTVFD